MSSQHGPSFQPASILLTARGTEASLCLCAALISIVVSLCIPEAACCIVSLDSYRDKKRRAFMRCQPAPADSTATTRSPGFHSQTPNHPVSAPVPTPGSACQLSQQQLQQRTRISHSCVCCLVPDVQHGLNVSREQLSKHPLLFHKGCWKPTNSVLERQWLIFLL